MGPRMIGVCRLFVLFCMIGLFVHFRKHLENWSSFLSHSFHRHVQIEEEPILEKKLPRKIIIILAHGRSGSSITGDIFNRHPSVFYLFEPLHFLDNILESEKPPSYYEPLATDVLSDVISCKFSKAFTKYIDSRGYKHSNFNSIAVRSPPLCTLNMTDPRWTLDLCHPLTSDSLEKVCRENYKVTVLKILIKRIEGKSIENVRSVCSSSEIDCKIILLIRDPRAVMTSARKVVFFHDDKKGSGLRQYSMRTCNETEYNLEIIKDNAQFWRDRILIHRYEDFATNPLKTLSRLFKFAGLSEEDLVKTWLNKSTHASYKEMQLDCKRKVLDLDHCTTANSAQRVNQWRTKASLRDILTIERYCKRTMILMGYKSVNGSRRVMSNVRIPLFSKEYPAKAWFMN